MKSLAKQFAGDYLTNSLAKKCTRNSLNCKLLWFNNEDRAWSILQKPISGAPKQQSSKPGISVGTDNDEIDTDLLGRIHYLFIGIPVPQDRFGLQTLGTHLFSNQRKLRGCLALCRFHMDPNRFVHEIQSVIERRRVVRDLENMQ